MNDDDDDFDARLMPLSNLYPSNDILDRWSWQSFMPAIGASNYLGTYLLA